MVKEKMIKKEIYMKPSIEKNKNDYGRKPKPAPKIVWPKNEF